jgi:hypothetical protein
MGIMDRVRASSLAQTEGNSQTGTESSTLAVVSPTLKRIRGTLSQFANISARLGDERQKRMQRVLSIIIDEASEELAELDESLLRTWIHSFATLMEWCATGDMSVLPSELIPFACAVEGIDPASLFDVSENDVIQEMQAIEA